MNTALATSHMEMSTTAPAPVPPIHADNTVTNKYARTEYSSTWNIEFTATRTAHNSLSPPASWFQTRTMAMHRARPIMIKPILYSGRSGRKIQARANISTGPITQFCTMDALSAFPCCFIL
ncbi:Uncharacterised protein [uncultured archaeon]|nr:Uncharacterised protein [uncultured archaeon]